MMLLDHMEECLVRRAAERYQKGETSLEEAAVLAKTSLWKMMDYVRRANICPPEPSIEESERNLEHARKLLGKRR